MNFEKEAADIIRKKLIDLALQYNNKEHFMNLTGDDWRKYIVNPEKEKNYVYIEKENDDSRIESFLLKKYRDEKDNNLDNLEEYIKQTTITDDFLEKKKVLFDLMMTTKNSNTHIYNLVKAIHHDPCLIRLLTVVTDKEYRNSVFHINRSNKVINIKEFRELLSSEINVDDIMSYLQYYKNHNIQFFLELKTILKA